MKVDHGFFQGSLAGMGGGKQGAIDIEKYDAHVGDHSLMRKARYLVSR